ncbi:MAG TPA: beta-ketoacyl-ACP synthase III [Myxococcota bacterium]|nr:beta-ketoacyl-ACP synthase III [Myxococcota bacterium]
MPAFITQTGSYLPGPPLDNDAMEARLGFLDDRSPRIKRRILRNNGIQTRHYALDEEGRPTESSASMAAKAIREATRDIDLTTIDLLACGTSIVEHIVPGHASSVHGELGSHPCEIVTTGGVCCAGMTALKYATMAVGGGHARRAVASGSERTSAFLRQAHFQAELAARGVDEDEPYVGFDQSFLRWMLSDGAGAMLVENEPRPNGLSLRVEWIELTSYANELPTCMYMGAERTPSGGLTSMWDLDSMSSTLTKGLLNLHQDVKLLGQHVVVAGANALLRAAEKHGLAPSDVDYLLPHYSSEFFRDKTHAQLDSVGFPIPTSKWRSNLVERGNTGCASIFVMLDDFLRSGELQPGQTVLLLVPESGRFSAAWALLRAQ